MDSLSSISRELVDAKRISSELHGAIRPPSQRPGVSSHRQRFAAAGPSVSRQRPYDFASGQPTSNSSRRSFCPGGDSPPPHKRRRLPDENSSDDERGSSAGRLLPDEEEGDEENCRPASLALLLDYIMSKFPAASKPLARLSNRLPDENSSDHGHDSSAGLLQPDEGEGDEENCRPASLALLLDCIMSNYPVAPKPLAQPSTRRFHVFGAAGFVQESSQRSSNISWFDHVQFTCASTQSKFETRIYEGKSLSSIMPSVLKVMKVSHSPCQEWELGQLPTIRLNELQTIGYQICPDVGERCCGAGENLAECLGVLQFPVEDDDGLIPLFWRLRPDSPGAVAFVTTRRGESFLSHRVPSVTEAQKRNLLSDPIFQQEDLFAPATLDVARHAARDVSLYKGAQSRPST